MPDLTLRNDQPTSLAARLGVVALCALWLLAGVFGHDPWKADDALHLGVAFGMNGGDWLVPRIAGDPWLTMPPLYHWVAVICGTLLDWLMPWHDAARMASAVFGALLLAILSRTTTSFAGASAGLAAPLLAIGTLGLVVPMHDAQPAIANLTGFALALLALSEWRNRPLRGGALFGLAAAISFLGIGIDGLLAILLTGGMLMAHPAWRNRHSLLAWIAALAVAAALILPWPWLLREHSTLLFNVWWSAELDSLSAHDRFTLRHLKLLAWSAWPVLPLALWTLWLERGRLWQPQILLPLVASCVAVLIFLADDPKPTALLPALVPLVVLAATGAGRMRRGAANAFDWFGMMTFTLLAGLIWLGGIAILTGQPERVAKNFTKPAPDFVAEANIPVILLAIAITVAWIAVMLLTPRSPWRAAARWSVGVTATWVLLIALWLPWIDYGKSYRIASADISRALGKYAGCIERRGLGLAQRASLDYFSGIRTVSQARAKNCDHAIVQTSRGSEKSLPGWTLLLETSRPGEKVERLRLYQRND